MPLNLEALVSSCTRSLRALPAAFLTFCKTPSPLRAVLLVVLALQPLLLALASRIHLGFWNYIVLNVVFVLFWRLSVYAYQKALPAPPEDEE